MRVGLISFWHLHGADYARAAAEHPGVDVAAIWDEDAERGAREARNRGIPFVDSLDDLLADTSIDGVVICSPTSDHAEVAVAAAQAGKHIFIEKVLADTLPDAQRIADAATAAGVVLTVSLWRSDKGYARQIADLLNSGTIGEMTSIRIRDGHPFSLPTIEQPDGYLPAHFYDPATTRGGILIDLCHPVYLLAMIGGLPSTAMGALGHVTGRAVEDNAATLVTYPSGAIGVAETSATSRITPFTIDVHGTGGSILYSEPGIGALVHGRRHGASSALPGRDDDASLRVFSGDGADGGWRQLDVEPDRPAAFDRWVALASAGTPDTDNVRLALELTALVEAAYRSASTGVRAEVSQPSAVARAAV